MTATASAQPSQSLVLEGKLEGGQMAIGGETTGYRLADVQVEVDLAGVQNAVDLVDQEVRLQGSFEPKEYVERGAVWVFRVTGAKRIADRSPFPDAGSSGASPAAPGGTAPGSGSTRASGGSGSSSDLLDQVRRRLREDPAFRAELQGLLQIQLGPAGPQ